MHMSEQAIPAASGTGGAGEEQHPAIFATTVCSIVEHGGELLMVRQLNREGEERWNFPTGWMASHDEDGNVQIPEHVVNRNLLMETGYAGPGAPLVAPTLLGAPERPGGPIARALGPPSPSTNPRQT